MFSDKLLSFNDGVIFIQKYQTNMNQFIWFNDI
jgi:hypothetical protein